MTSDRCALYRQFMAVDGAYRSGDLDALKEALGDPEGFPNCLLPFETAAMPFHQPSREPQFDTHHPTGAIGHAGSSGVSLSRMASNRSAAMPYTGVADRDREPVERLDCQQDLTRAG
jgi:hypothetical protein